jgi:hypothetical protein
MYADCPLRRRHTTTVCFRADRSTDVRAFYRRREQSRVACVQTRRRTCHPVTFEPLRSPRSSNPFHPRLEAIRHQCPLAKTICLLGVRSFVGVATRPASLLSVPGTKMIVRPSGRESETGARETIVPSEMRDLPSGEGRAVGDPDVASSFGVEHPKQHAMRAMPRRVRRGMENSMLVRG